MDCKRLYVKQYHLIQMLCGGTVVTDVMDGMDIMDVMDVADVTDVIDITDVAVVTDVTDITICTVQYNIMSLQVGKQFVMNDLSLLICVVCGSNIRTQSSIASY